MREEIMQELYKTFTLSSRKGTGGMTFKYVPNEDVITRMNKVFKGNWSTVVKHKDMIEDQVLVEVQVTITDPDSAETYTQTGYGSSQIARYKDGPNAGRIIDIGNAYKGSLSKAIVNACTRWGVGLIKERDAYNEEEVTSVVDPVMPSVPPTVAPTPAPTPAPVAPVVPETPTVAVSPIVVEPPTSVGHDTPPAVPNPAPAIPVPPVPTPVVEPPPVAETTTTFPPPVVPEQVVSASINVEQEKVKAPPEMPKVPAPNVEAPIAPPATTPEPELPMSNPDTGLGEIKISDVQKVALNGILTMNNAEYQPLAEEAFSANGINKAVPTREDLTYEEAVVVIKYGNEKYRKNR